MADPTAEFEDNRRLMTGLAYRMTGSVAEAEDIVQDAWLRWRTVDHRAVVSARAYLLQVVTRLCLDHARSAEQRRMAYVGQWLPEPAVDAEPLASLAGILPPDQARERADDVSMALLLVLQRLSPEERIAFLLHDALDLTFDEVAAHLGKSAAACRQLASRGRRRLSAERPEAAPPPAVAKAAFAALHQALVTHDALALSALLAENMVLITDGGGVKTAARNPIKGRWAVLRFFTGLALKNGAPPPSAIHQTTLNGADAIIIVEDDGQPQTWCFQWTAEGLVQSLFLLRNPRKLQHLRLP